MGFSAALDNYAIITTGDNPDLDLFIMKQLSKNQLFKLTDGKKHWSEKKEYLIKLAKNFGIIINNDEELRYLIEVHCPSELERINIKFYQDSKSGVIRNNYTPTDVKGTFIVPNKYIIGAKYHISWAYSGAVFVLRKIVDNIAYLDNPRYKRKDLLKCDVKDLRNLKNKNT